MIRVVRFVFIVCVCLINSINLFGQGTLEGIVIDSTYNKMVQSSSVALYEVGFEEIQKVTLTDRYGKFKFDKLDATKDYSILISMLGYRKKEIKFRLGLNEQLSLGHINLIQESREIDAIEILPPVRMNRDTIEFNADAFNLDPNSVVEDLLYKLPGIVIWGDGAITYNGREVQGVLVNGKPFFGTDKSIALKNIDKTAVDKLQIYDNRSEYDKKTDPDDKKFGMNIVLKDGKEFMYFGMLGLGLGSNKRHQEFANLNLANRKSQASFGYSGNNVNKNLSNLEQLLKNTTYRGVGINADFDSDFKRQGLINQQVLATRYQYDFQNNKEVGRNNMLIVDAAARWNTEKELNENLTQLLSNTDEINNFRQYHSEKNNEIKLQNLNLKYDKSITNKVFNKRNLTAAINVFAENNEHNNLADEIWDYNYDNQQSVNHVLSSSMIKNKLLRFNSNLNLSSLIADNDGFRKDAGFWNSLRYGLILNVNLNDQDQNLNREGDYQNRLEPNDNNHQQRNYSNTGEHKDFSSKFTITDGWYSLEQRVRSYLKDQNNLVEDLLNGNHSNNMDLTYYSNFRQNEYETSLGTNRVIWSRNLHGRSNTRLSFDAKLAYQIIQYSNESNLDYRNIRSNFNHPKVSFNIHHSFNKTSSYSILSDIQYFNTKDYPQADQQMVGIYDDIVPGYRFLGANRDLQLASINNYFGQISFNENNTFGFVANLNFNYKTTTNSFSDSLVYKNNEQINYIVQIKDPVQQLNFGFNLAKPFNLNEENKLTTKFATKSTIFRRIQFIGDEMQKMQNIHQNYDLSIYYNALNKLQIGILNALNLYKRYDLLNEEGGHAYRSKDFSTGISASYSPLKDLVIGSNLMSRHVNSNISTDNAVIWNANIAYRMLKGDNLEVKLAAYDLLNQNKAIYIIDTPTEVTSGLKNSLNQYFMLTVSFMPRKFGK